VVGLLAVLAVSGVIACTHQLVTGGQAGPVEAAGVELVVVAECPWCGAPVYGRPAIVEGEQALVSYSCPCHEHVDELVIAAIDARERARRARGR